MLRHVLWEIFTDVSEEHVFSVFGTGKERTIAVPYVLYIYGLMESRAFCSDSA
jgi:hypothetical protein